MSFQGVHSPRLAQALAAYTQGQRQPRDPKDDLVRALAMQQLEGSVGAGPKAPAAPEFGDPDFARSVATQSMEGFSGQSSSGDGMLSGDEYGERLRRVSGLSKALGEAERRKGKGVNVKTLDYSGGGAKGGPKSRKQIDQRKALSRALAANAARQQGYGTHPQHALIPLGAQVASGIHGWRANREEQQRRDHFAGVASSMEPPPGIDPQVWQGIVADNPEAAVQYLTKHQQAVYERQLEAQQAERERLQKIEDERDMARFKKEIEAQFAEPQLREAADGHVYVVGQTNPDGSPVRAFPGVEKAPDLTTLQRNYDAAVGQGYKGSILDYQLETSRAGATNVNVGAEESSYAKEIGKQNAQWRGQIRDQAYAAQDALNALNVMEYTMNQPGFYSGAGGEQVAALRRFGAALGMDIEGIDSMEAFNAQSKSLALAAMGGSLGTGFSNADRDFVLDQVPGLGVTPEGNRMLIEIQRRLNGRKIEIAQLADEYIADNNGQLDTGFDAVMRQHAENNPLFADLSEALGKDMPVPQAGEVVDGYRFNGGDPNDRNNWQKVTN